MHINGWVDSKGLWLIKGRLTRNILTKYTQTTAFLFFQEAMIDQRNLNCTASVLRPPKNASSILRNICRVNRQLKRIERQLQDVTSQPMPELSSLVQELGHSLKCWCKSKNKSSKLLHKWTLCKVKHILDTLQTYFEQYNASQSVNPDPSRRGKIK